MKTDVLIVGGGFAGATTAAAFSQLGADVTVLEATSSTVRQFRGELIHPKGVRALDSFGLKSCLFDAGGVEVKGFAVSEHPYTAPTVLDYVDGAGPGLGIDHATMVLALRDEAARRPGVTVKTNARVSSLIERDGEICGARTEDGTQYDAKLVVLADGRTSRLREGLGMKPNIKLVSYTAALAAEGPDLLPERDYGHVFLGAPGPILAYPYANGRVRFCIDVPLGAPKGQDGIAEYLETKYAPQLPHRLRAALVAATQSRHFEVCATHSISTVACAAPGVVAVGDAAGCAHPLTASGMTNAMNDIKALTEELAKGGISATALERYQRRRYDFVRMRELFTEALYDVFVGAQPGERALRRGVFRYWRTSERARRESMKLLSGEDVRPWRFVAEYTRVMGESAVDLFEGVTRAPRLKERSTQLSSLLTAGAGRIEHTIGQAANSTLERYRRGLLSVSAQPPSA